MKKTYWWRILISLFGLVLFGYNYYAAYVDSSNLYNAYTDPLLFVSISIIIGSLALYFVSDSVFKKWLKFTGIWFFITTIMIILSPEYQGGWLGIGPEKESVSIFMSVLFVIVSLVKLVWDVRKEKITSKATQ